METVRGKAGSRKKHPRGDWQGHPRGPWGCKGAQASIRQRLRRTGLARGLEPLTEMEGGLGRKASWVASGGLFALLWSVDSGESRDTHGDRNAGANITQPLL